MDFELIPDSLNNSFSILATDLDSKENSRLNYELLTKHNFFNIDKKFGKFYNRIF